MRIEQYLFRHRQWVRARLLQGLEIIDTCLLKRHYCRSQIAHIRQAADVSTSTGMIGASRTTAVLQYMAWLLNCTLQLIDAAAHVIDEKTAKELCVEINPLWVGAINKQLRRLGSPAALIS